MVATKTPAASTTDGEPTGAASPRGLVIGAALAAVYLIWGSTYLAIRFGLEGFPPFLLSAIRFLVAGGILYAVLRLRGTPAPTRRQWWNAARVGALMLAGGVGLVTMAEDLGVGSGVAATAVAVIPLWAALVSGLFGRWPMRLEWVGLVVGFVLAESGLKDFHGFPEERGSSSIGSDCQVLPESFRESGIKSGHAARHSGSYREASPYVFARFRTGLIRRNPGGKLSD